MFGDRVYQALVTVFVAIPRSFPDCRRRAKELPDAGGVCDLAIVRQLRQASQGKTSYYFLPKFRAVDVTATNLPV